MRTQVSTALSPAPNPAITAGIPLGNYDRFHLSADSGCASLRTLAPHDPLFCEGDPNGYLYEVLDGIMCNYKLMPDGRRQVISFSYPGDLVGLGGGDAYAFSADAVSAVRVRCISAAMLDRQIRQMPELGSKLLQATTSELCKTRNRLLTLGRRTALERLASLLIEVAQRSGDGGCPAEEFDLPMTRADIADFLGLTIETVSRNLTKLRVSRVIDLPQPTKVVIQNMDRLEELTDLDANDF